MLYLRCEEWDVQINQSYFFQFSACAVKCWTCNNLLQPFCNDPFDPSKANEIEKFLLNDCASNICVKQVDTISSESCSYTSISLYIQNFHHSNLSLFLLKDLNSGKPTITRLCAKNEEHAKELCDNKSAKPEFSCKMCDTDGCNGAAQYGPIALLVIIPVAVARILAF